MTSTHSTDVHQTAARAALEVPGVAALQPALADRLAAAASRVRHVVGAAPHPDVTGIRAEHVPESGWRVEVRCVLHDGRRVVDVARQVRERVRTAVSTYLTQHGAPAPVTVQVTVTRTL
ncbi:MULTISPECIES: Asp23/Gls24 family envelope stress response protein [unclassified Streptomyces]|uniref:Asp23/Gls24 family envelope stress response protein n=1 Tax=unclassified Streptomyces TaxID=2593676 RepID=UPI001BE4EEF6|nr:MULTISPECIES: Asp23/Gls24 family envelope stress response protein [unclassified Streptomyces]MBT2404926.1 Asp23/Gls24 family envelope stress response protein [Streptomyces sp. ISL-21]MBT2455956.1 Asp23/Gls24 family envelope stress response protein [Streptomyces sp. ISL-86]MBT2611345.1 Asp23/Gls24 family envelope stress response protein [Streptomyces sp. ISL-87]